MICFLLLLQGNSLWHPQWIMQIWCHPGKHYLCFFCWDHQSGPHPSGCHFSCWGWPDCSSTARDSRTGPDVTTSGERKCWKNLVQQPYLPHPSCPSLSRGHLDSPGGEVVFVTPSLALISAVHMFVTQVTDLGVSWSSLPYYPRAVCLASSVPGPRCKRKDIALGHTKQGVCKDVQ